MPEKSTNEFAFTVTIQNVMRALGDEIWIADSGSSQHMNSRKKWFTDFTECHNGRFVKVANNEKIPILLYGTITDHLVCGYDSY